MKRIPLLLAAILLTSGIFAEVITVATLNVWSGLTYQGFFRTGTYEDSATREFRYDLLLSGLESLAPDIIALQEANPLPSFANRISEDLGYDAVYDVRQGGVRIGVVGLPGNLREGSVVLADRERTLTRLRAQQLSGPAAGNLTSFQFSPSSQIVAAQVEIEGRPVYVFTTRWTPSPPADSARLETLLRSYTRGELSGEALTEKIEQAVEGSERRKEEARQTLTFINELAGEQPVILMGSFHAIPTSAEIQMLRDAGFIDVWASVGRGPGYTYDSGSNTNVSVHGLAAEGHERARYDYVFVRGNGIYPRRASIIFNRPTFGVHPSDHYGVWAELRVDPE